MPKHKRGDIFILGITDKDVWGVSAGTTLVGGVYDFFSTHGLPFDVLFDKLAENKMMPVWELFFREGEANGTTRERLLSKIRIHVLDSYGKETLTRIEEMLANG